MTRSAQRLLTAVLAAATTLLSSCGAPKSISLSSQERAAMRGKTVVISKRELPGFAVITPGKAITAGLTGPVGGAVVGLSAAKEGQSLLRQHQVTAPETTVAQKLAKPLADRTGARVIPATTSVSAGDAKSLSYAYPKADYVLDVATTVWMGSYYPMTFAKYFIMHGTRMVLVERSSGRVVAQGFHVYQGKDKDHAPNYDGIFANNAAFLKAETKKSTDGAISEFSGLF